MKLYSLLFLTTLQYTLAELECHRDDLKALLDFKAGVSIDNGGLDSWDGSYCCSWENILCNNVTGRVISLSFEGLGGPDSHFNYETMEGTISASLGKLSFLEHLSFSDLPFLTGSIPHSLGNIPTLKHIYLHHTSVNGSIPNSVGGLSQLETLHLSENKLSGSIPKDVGSLSNLQYLEVRSNQLIGGIPSSLGNLKSIKVIDLSENKLTGSIPSSFGNLKALEQLSLFGNRLSGSIPPALGSLSKIVSLTLSHNKLAGGAPSSLAGLSSLRSLYLDHNKLGGSIPDSWSKLKNLVWIDLSYNRLTGSIPHVLTTLPRLEQLFLSHNKLTGNTIPDFSGTPLSSLDLSYNDLDLGTVPSWLRAWNNPDIESHLSLASCGIKHVPSFISQTNLFLLDLSMNNIKGGVPKLPMHLYHLNLSYNPLSTSFTNLIGSGTNLSTIDLHSTLLHGPFPSSLIFTTPSRFSSIHLDLSHNDLTGKITSLPKIEDSFLTTWYYLNLSSNKLEGFIPSTLSDLVHLQVLDLSHNRFRGRILKSIGNLTELQTVDLSFNGLTGGIPKELMQLEFLTSLNLSNNMLSGEISNGSHAFPASSFANNPRLCGAPLPPCK